MNQSELPELRIGPFTVKLPIIQGGMGVGISMSGLASAVANEGGIGVIAAVGLGMLEPDFNKNFREANIRALRREIRKARALSGGVVGVNIMVALSDFEELLTATAEEEVDLILLGAGLPLKVPQILSPDRVREGASRLVPIVSSDRAAAIILKSWEKAGCFPDAFVVEGPLAGGHLGFKREQISDPDHALEQIVPEVIRAVRPYEQKAGRCIPVVAAGGIYTGEDIFRFLGLGASGVQMASRFVPTVECDADPAFKMAYVNAAKEDLMIIDSPVGLPGRAIRNRFLEEVGAGVKKPFKCPWKCLRTCDFVNAPYCIGLALTNAKLGRLDDGFVFGGANAYRSERITSVHEVIQSILAEYHAAAERDVRLHRREPELSVAGGCGETSGF
ncbi:nitronate monooxygenase [bacterium]|nr:nitronate monooxygenase [bacterium]